MIFLCKHVSRLSCKNCKVTLSLFCSIFHVIASTFLRLTHNVFKFNHKLQGWLSMHSVCLSVFQVKELFQVFSLCIKLFCSAYQNNDINEFEVILKSNKASIMDDPFIREHIEGCNVFPLSILTAFINFFRSFIELLRNIRTQVMIKLIKPYTRIHLPYLSKELNIDVAEVENLLVQCILDG